VGALAVEPPGPSPPHSAVCPRWVSANTVLALEVAGSDCRPGYARYALSSRASGGCRSSSGSAASDTGTVWLGSLDYPPTWQHAADDLGPGGNRSQVNHMLHQSRRSPCGTQCPRGVRGWQLTGSAAHPDHDDRLDRAPPRHPPGILGSVWRTPVSAEQRPWVPCQPPGRRLQYVLRAVATLPSGQLRRRRKVERCLGWPAQRSFERIRPVTRIDVAGPFHSTLKRTN
jgi:hypothetical protein